MELNINKDLTLKTKTQSVKFGNFEVIEIATEDSDEHFALIK